MLDTDRQVLKNFMREGNFLSGARASVASDRHGFFFILRDMHIKYVFKIKFKLNPFSTI